MSLILLHELLPILYTHKSLNKFDRFIFLSVVDDDSFESIEPKRFQRINIPSFNYFVFLPVLTELCEKSSINRSW